MALVETEVAEGVMTITLADEPRRNALSAALLDELVGAIDVAESDPTIRVIVVTNRGSVFCAGADLREQVGRPATGDVGLFSLSELFVRIQRSPLPFVGRVMGHCVAGGVGLAAVLDICVSVDSATFGFSEVRVGVAPAIISVVCLAKMRRADAQSAFLRGNRFAASDALDMGLIARVATLEAIDDEVTAIVNDLLAGEPGALAAAKQLTHVVPSMGVDEAFAWTSALSNSLFRSDHAREGMTAFLEKRPAIWVQRLSSPTDEPVD